MAVMNVVYLYIIMVMNNIMVDECVIKLGNLKLWNIYHTLVHLGKERTVIIVINVTSTVIGIIMIIIISDV